MAQGRALWKGWLKVAELLCPVALHGAVSDSERIDFHIVNRATGNRVRRVFVDSASGKPVPAEDQTKGYEIAPGEFLEISREEVDATIPEGDKTLDVTAFVALDLIDMLFLDRPYFLVPADAAAHEAFALVRQGLERTGAGALARAVLFRRERSLLVQPHAGGLMATTLHFDYEVRAPAEAFAELPRIKVEGEMLELAEHIIGTKTASFDPRDVDDRYEAALADMIRSKIDGTALQPPAHQPDEKVINLLEALRASADARAGQSKSGAQKKKAGKSRSGGSRISGAPTPSRRKAG